MELKIKVKSVAFCEVEKIITIVREIEKEHSCHCTLLEIEAN